MHANILPLRLDSTVQWSDNDTKSGIIYEDFIYQRIRDGCIFIQLFYYIFDRQVEQLKFVSTLTLKIYLHSKLCLAIATHNLERVKITYMGTIWIK